MSFHNKNDKQIIDKLQRVFIGRTFLSVFFLAGVLYLHFKFNIPSFIGFTILTLTVVLLSIGSVYYAFRNYSIVYVAYANALPLLLIILIGIHYTGGISSPGNIFLILLIAIPSVLSGSTSATAVITVSIIIGFDLLVFLETKGYFYKHTGWPFSSYNNQGNDYPILPVIILNWAVILTALFIGYLSRLLGKIRNQLSDALDENVKLQELIKGFVSHRAWTEAEQTARSGAPEMETYLGTTTIFFIDVVGFSSLSENLSPELIIALLNDNFSIVSEIIYKHNGDIDKFMGDCIMAIFPAAENAVNAAFEIQDIFKTTSGKSHILQFRIGINTGSVVFGNMGNSVRMDRTVIGDTVNIAQRLENEAPPGGVLISQSTYDELHKDFVNVEWHKTINIKGRTQPIDVYCVSRI